MSVLAVGERPAGMRLPAGGWIGPALLVALCLLALVAPRLAPYAPLALPAPPLTPPGGSTLLGTDTVGHDVVSQLLWGSRISLGVGVVAGALALCCSALLGLLTGYVGGVVDGIALRVIDMLLALPQLPLLLLVATFLGPGVVQEVLVIGLLGWMVPARVIRAQVRTLRHAGHVDAARMLGGGPLYVLRRHVVPAIGPLCAATLVAQTGRAVAIEAALGFLGLGSPTEVSWGTMIGTALGDQTLWVSNAWSWLLLPPSAAIALFLLGTTLTTRLLERRLDPRLGPR